MKFCDSNAFMLNKYLNFVIYRAPDRSYMLLHQYNNMFNLTMTHRLHSDFPWTYGEVYDIESDELIAPALKVRWKKPQESFKGESLSFKCIKTKS